MQAFTNNGITVSVYHPNDRYCTVICASERGEKYCPLIEIGHYCDQGETLEDAARWAKGLVERNMKGQLI